MAVSKTQMHNYSHVSNSRKMLPCYNHFFSNKLPCPFINRNGCLIVTMAFFHGMFSQVDMAFFSEHGKSTFPNLFFLRIYHCSVCFDVITWDDATR